MSVRHSIAISVVISTTFALVGCDRVKSGLEAMRKRSKPEAQADVPPQISTGTQADARPLAKVKALPSVTNVSLSKSLRDSSSSLPKKRTMSWHVPPAPPGLASQAIDLGPAISGGWRPLGAAVSASGRAVVTYTNPRDFEDGNGTRMALIDVRQGRIESAWEVPDLCVPLDIHPDGMSAILCRQDDALSERDMLYVYRLPYEGTPSADEWQPLVPEGVEPPPSKRQTQVRWLKFAGPSRLVTLNDDQTIHIWDYPSKANITYIPNVVGTPAVSPDGSRIAFLTEDLVGLIDPSIPEVVAIRRVGPLPTDPALAFRSDGTQMVITGATKTILFDLVTGKLTHSETTRTRTRSRRKLVPDLAWIGSFLYHDENIYDFESAYPLWHYSGIEWASPEDDRLWVILRSSRSRRFVLQPIHLPLEKVEAQVMKTYSPELIALRKADKVRVDVTAIPEKYREKVRERLVEQLTENGFRVFDQAAIVLRASIDQPKQSAVNYINVRGAFSPRIANPMAQDVGTCYFNRQPARLQFIKRNRVLWSSSQYILPPVWLHEWPEGSTLTEYGGPDYELFNSRQLPRYIRGNRNSVIGRTQLMAE